MSPDPNILGAKTVDQLMTVLRAAPYHLPVPALGDLPSGSALIPLWKGAVVVTAQDGGQSYRAFADTSWLLLPALTIVNSLFCLKAFPAASPGRARAAAELMPPSRSPNHRPTRRRR